MDDPFCQQHFFKCANLTFIIFAVPRSCNEYKNIGVTTSGYYLIDPKQQKGISTKIHVFCDFEIGKSENISIYLKN